MPETRRRESKKPAAKGKPGSKNSGPRSRSGPKGPARSKSPGPARPKSPEPRSRGPDLRPERQTRPRLPDDVLRGMFLTMLLAREWDLRFENLLRTGAVSKWYSGVGNEALTVASAFCLEDGDALATLHRDVGAILGRYVDVRALVPEFFGEKDPGEHDEGVRRSREYLHRLACQMLAGSEGFTGGFERSYHYGNVDAETGHIHVGMISHLGTMIPVAAGLAFALKRSGSKRVALNFIGEGGTSTGDFHEGLNIASVYKLPLILIVENNHYAFSTPTREQYACDSLADRGAAYGIPGRCVDACDAQAVYRVCVEAVERARRGQGPTLIEGMLGRLRGHSEQDRSLDLLTSEERELFQKRDPLPRFSRWLTERRLVDAATLESAKEKLRGLLIEITDAAREAPGPDPEFALQRRSVFAVDPEAAVPEPVTRVELTDSGGSTYLEAISRALREELDRDPKLVLLGQDIAELGGAFQVTAGFLKRFGRDRIINTPIAESGTLGLAAGASLLGIRSVVEMQFADFVSCGFNQLANFAAKLHFRCGQSVPLVVRCPTGGGGGGGPFHSQCPESWFTHTAGLKVVCPAFPVDALGLLKAAIRDPNPVLYFEHKYLYRRVRQELPADDVVIPLGSARIVRAGSDASVITYGWMVHRALEAAALLQEEGIDVEVVDLRTLIPLDEATVLDSVRRTSKALVLHEAPLTGGFGGEVAARISENAFEDLDAPVRRLAYPDVPVPCHPDLEAACLPSVKQITEALKELANY